MDKDVKDLITRLANFDWCIGYDLTTQDMIELDRLQEKARKLLEQMESSDDQ